MTDRTDTQADSEQPTQQLRRPALSPLPGPLDPTRRQPEPADSTAVLSLDEIMEAGAESDIAPESVTERALVTEIVVVTPSPEALAATPLAPSGRTGAPPPAAGPRTPGGGASARPVRQRPARQHAIRQRARSGTQVAGRLRSDANAALVGAGRRTTTWFGSGDNALIIATILVAALLLVVVASL